MAQVDAHSPALSDPPLFVSNAYITLKKSQESLLNGDVVMRQFSNCPLSPTHYQQPPTPEHPPPTAQQAERSIHERIRPLSQVTLSHSNCMSKEGVVKRRHRQLDYVGVIQMCCCYFLLTKKSKVSCMVNINTPPIVERF